MSTKTPLPPKPDNLPGRGSIWQHSKGTFYRVVGYSRHSENPDQWLVTYRPLTGDGDDWTRALVSTEQNGWPGFLDNFTSPAFQGDKGWQRFKHIGGPLTWKDEPAPEELCEDVGCPHYGTPHVCVSVTESSGNVFADLGLPDADRLLAEADARIDAMPRSGSGS